MKKFLVALNNFRTGQSSYFIAYAESKFDNNLISAINDEYVELYRDFYYLDYEAYNDVEDAFDEFLIDMYFEIEEWTKEIEEDYGNNIPILYNENTSN